MNISALTALMVAFRNKIGAKIERRASSMMERGWVKRGDGTAVQRTLKSGPLPSPSHSNG